MSKNTFRVAATHKRGCVLVAILMAVSGPMLAADAELRPEWMRLVATFEHLVARDSVVGASIGLVENGRLIDRRDHGFSDRASGRKVDGDTIFHWASITKTLNAIGVLQMRERGKLTLNDPIVRYVPELRRMHNPYTSMDSITVGMLLSHTAGFQGSTWPYRTGASWEPFEPTQWEQVVAMMPYQRIESWPGMKFSYSNPSWIYLARMVEQMSGDSWQYYIQKNVFGPIGMTRSYFGYTPPYLAEHRSHSYVIEKSHEELPPVSEQDGEFDPGITIPNGGWNAPLEDVATYIGFLTNATGGDPMRQRRYDSVLLREAIVDMWTPRISTSDKPDAEKIGLAFFVTGDGKRRVVGHTGSQGDFVSFMYFNPETGLGVVAAFNTVNLNRPESGPGFFPLVKTAAIEFLR